MHLKRNHGQYFHYCNGRFEKSLFLVAKDCSLCNLVQRVDCVKFYLVIGRGCLILSHLKCENAG